jgi:hypothetical protein
MVAYGVGAFGEHQVVVGGIPEERQKHGSLPACRIRGDDDWKALG